MNYLRMVEHVSIDSDKIISRFHLTEREFYKNNIMPLVVPTYMLLESSFQSAGRLLRVRNKNKAAGIIASFRNYSFSRPVFVGEIITINCKYLRGSKEIEYYGINMIDEDNDYVMNNQGILVMLHEVSILSESLSTQNINNIKKYKEQFSYD